MEVIRPRSWLEEGDVLYFKYGGAGTLFMKIFGVTRCGLKRCMESDDSDTSHDDDGDAPSSGGSESNNSPSVKSEDEDCN